MAQGAGLPLAPLPDSQDQASCSVQAPPWHRDHKPWRAAGLREGPGGGTPCPALPCPPAAFPLRAVRRAGSPYLAVHSRADGQSQALGDWALKSLQRLQQIAEVLQENGAARGGSSHLKPLATGETQHIWAKGSPCHQLPGKTPNPPARGFVALPSEQHRDWTQPWAFEQSSSRTHSPREVAMPEDEPHGCDAWLPPGPPLHCPALAPRAHASLRPPLLSLVLLKGLPRSSGHSHRPTRAATLGPTRLLTLVTWEVSRTS